VSSVADRRGPANGRIVTLSTPLAAAARRTRTAGARVPRIGDPVVVGLVALVIYAAHGYDGVLDRDLGMFVYGGEHVAHGTPPYVGIFNSVGPLADAVPGLAIWLGHLVGVGPILSSRLAFTLLSAGCCSLLCVLARDTLGSRAAGLLAPAVFMTFHGFLVLASDGPREKTTMVLFVLACLVFLGRRCWLAAGVCAALATLTWQPALGAAIGALVAAVLLDRQGIRARILVRFGLGAALPGAAAVTYFLGAGALSRAFDGFVVVNVRYTEQPSALAHPGATWSTLWASYGVTLPLALAGLAALLALGVRACPSARRPTASPIPRRLVSVATGALAASLWTLTAINGAADLFVLLPFAALGVAGTVVAAADRLPRRAALAAVAAVTCLGVFAAGTESVTTRDDRLLAQRADVAAVLGALPADADLVTLNAAQVLAISGRTSPTPYQYFSDNILRYLVAEYPGRMRGFLTHLERLDPTVVAVGSTFRGLWPYGWLTRDYVRIGTGAGVSWYISRGVGPAVIARARLAHHQALRPYRR
jgi:hypothetical protein